jgi:hypothetical protein
MNGWIDEGKNDRKAGRMGGGEHEGKDGLVEGSMDEWL